MPPIKGVALDAEGVMFDFEMEGHHSAHRRVARELGVELSPMQALEEIPNLVGGPSKLIAQQIHDLVTRRTGGCPLTPEEIREKSIRYFKELFYKVASGEAPLEPRPGFLTALGDLRDSSMHLQVAVGSSTWPEEFWLYWLRTGLADYFSVGNIVLADESNGIRHKPEPDIFLKTAEVMGIDPSEQLVFEDSQRGVEAAVKAGSIVIGITTYDHPREMIRLIEAGAKRVFCSWLEFDAQRLIRSLRNS